MFFKPKKKKPKEPKPKKNKTSKKKTPKKPYTIEEMMLYDWIWED